MASKQQKLDSMYMKIAELQAEQSCAVRAKVGACAVTENGVLLTGWNGTPPGYPNACEETLPDGTLRTLDDVLHAEENAVNKAAREGVSLKGSTMYVTLQPCRKCSAVLKSAGILRLVYKEEYTSASRSGSGTEQLKNCGILVEQLRKD